MTEILAPAGGMEQLIAAVRAGADAVYLGAQNFNARRNAGNFTSLGEAVSYCQERGVKVYITLNTLVKDSELPLVLETLREIAASGADGVIVQDLAVARLVRESIPSLPLHASTQMTIHNVAGAKELERLGFSRVVLARELSLEEIRTIAESTNLEIECFLHGALCMCVSGACYLSSILGERSGNRGLCAQPCRLDWHLHDKTFALSLKDACLIPHLQQMQEAGVTSFKIEGRMKRPEYVFEAVDACKKALQGEQPDLNRLRAVFSRSGFTDGYLTGKRDASMFGFRQKEDVLAAAPILGEIASEYRLETQRVPLHAMLTVTAGQPICLTFSDHSHTVTVSGDSPAPALTHPLTTQEAEKAICQTGGTPYKVTEFSAVIGEGLSVPLAVLKTLRRDGVEALSRVRATLMPHPFLEPTLTLPPHHCTNPMIRVRGTWQQLQTLEADQYVLPIDELLAHPEAAQKFSGKLLCELPPLFFPPEETPLKEKLEAVRALGVTDGVCENLGAVSLARNANFRLHGGHGLNILNSIALEEYRQFVLASATLSLECACKEIRAMGGELSRGVLVYGYLPLMRMRACPAKTLHGCGSCTGNNRLIDRKGISFPLVCSERQFTTLYNSLPLFVCDKLPKTVDFYTYYFTQETPEEAAQILCLGKSGTAPEFPRTNGLYFRELR